MYWIMNGLTTRSPLHAPADLGGGGSSGDGDGDGDGGGEASGVDAAGDGDGGGDANAVVRPDFIPEKFWRDDYILNGEGDEKSVDWAKIAEDMAGHHRAAENKIFTRKEDLIKEVREELEADMAKPKEGFPESPDKYEVKISQDITGPGQEISFDDDDPHAQWFRQTAHDLGLTNDQFNKIINEYVGIQYAQMPDYQEEVEKLGEMGDMRIERAASWARANFSEEAFGMMENLAVTAGWIKVVEEIMELAGQPKFEVQEDGDIKSHLSMEDLKAMQADPKYWKEQDPAFIAKVRAGFAAHAKRSARGQ